MASITIFYGKRYRTLRSAEIEVIIIPPNADYHTDNEDIGEDNLQPADFPKDVADEIEGTSPVMMKIHPQPRKARTRRICLHPK